MFNIAVKKLLGNKKRTKKLCSIIMIITSISLLLISFQESLLKTKDNTLLQNQNDTPLEIFFREGKMVPLIIIISIIIISYVLSTYMRENSYSLKIIRCLGATYIHVIALGLYESCIILIVGLVSGILLGIVGTLLIFLFAKIIIPYPVFFGVKLDYYFQVLSTIAVCFFLLYIGLMLQNAVLHMESSFKKNTTSIKNKKLLNLKKAEKITMLKLCERNRMMNFARGYFMVIISSFVIVVSSVCIQNLWKGYSQFLYWEQQIGHEYIFQTEDLEQGLSKREINEVLKIPGIMSVECNKVLSKEDASEKIMIRWPGWLESDYVNTHRIYTQVNDKLQPHEEKEDYFLVQELRGVSPDDTETLSKYEKILGFGKFDKEAFNKGKECILFLSPYEIRDLGYDQIDMEPVYIDDKENTNDIYEYKTDQNGIKVGDTISVISPWGEESIKVGGIVTDIIPKGENVIAVGDEFIDTLRGVTGKELYNEVIFYSSEDADYIETDQLVNDYFAQKDPDIYIDNTRLTYQEIADQFMSNIVQMIFLISILWIIYLLVMYQVNTGYLDNERYRIGILSSFGMSKRKMTGMFLMEYLQEVFMIMGLSLLLLLVWYIFRLRMDTSFDSISMFVFEVQNDMDRLMMFIRGGILSFILYFTMNIAILYVPVKRVLKLPVIKNINN